MKAQDQEIMRALINQVMKAANGRVETEVVTFITKPMWRAFLRATGTPVNSKPTDWNGVHTVRVYGSKTVVLKSKRLYSVSFHIETFQGAQSSRGKQPRTQENKKK